MQYITRDKDVLDHICLLVYGTSAVFPAVLSANPGLAEVGPLYDSGRIIQLPDLLPTVIADTNVINLWD